MEEEYKKIDGYDNYEVSNFGNVRNTNTGRILKNHKNIHGYYIVDLHKEGTRKTLTIHRLIGLHFIPNPDNLREIDHIDRNRTNNSISNLRWISNSNNLRNRPKFKNSTSKYIGVSFHKPTGKYLTRITINNKLKYIGLYETQEEVRKAWDNYVKDHNLTEFYELNFPDNAVLS